ncbi:unnamed protein product [Dovyalis caffra]|uniref:Uncharacterized protein n=1 Tax=Dovyalis caffra TaxID=77055 RepID=A0AAV1RQD5_9ROSI|nr:unnamed protein product [Dovyalis caffra]
MIEGEMRGCVMAWNESFSHEDATCKLFCGAELSSSAANLILKYFLVLLNQMARGDAIRRAYEVGKSEADSERFLPKVSFNNFKQQE